MCKFAAPIRPPSKNLPCEHKSSISTSTILLPTPMAWRMTLQIVIPARLVESSLTKIPYCIYRTVRFLLPPNALSKALRLVHCVIDTSYKSCDPDIVRTFFSMFVIVVPICWGAMKRPLQTLVNLSPSCKNSTGEPIALAILGFNTVSHHPFRLYAELLAEEDLSELGDDEMLGSNVSGHSNSSA